MLHFIRRLRHRLLTENRFGKYLFYAVGEIMLVVIGILIALQIDTWNEERKNEEAARALFANIQQDIEKDIARSDFILDQFAGISIMMQRIFDFEDPITEAEFLEGADNIESGFRRPVGARALPFIITESGYQNVINQLENIPEKYKPVLNNLTSLYSSLIPLAELYHNRLQAFVDPHLEFRSRQNWELYRLRYHRPSQAEMDYFLNDDRYKSYLIKWENDTENMLMVSQRFRRMGIKIHNQIDSLMGRQEPTFPERLLHRLKPGEFEEYQGVYAFPGDSAYREELYIRDGELYSRTIQSDEGNVEGPPLLQFRRVRDSIFAVTYPPSFMWWQFFKFTRDEHGKKAIDLIDYEYKGPMKRMVKIEQ